MRSTTRSKQFHVLYLCALFVVGCSTGESDVTNPGQAVVVNGEEAAVEPLPADVATLDGIIDAYYDVVSGPAGEVRDRMRDKSIHHVNARAIITDVDSLGKPVISNMTIDEYHDRFGSGGSAFYEKEIHRVTQQFGSVTHVWSTYAWSTEPDGDVGGRGINSIQLYNDGDRWWVMNWIFDSERPDNPIPAEYLN